MSEWEFDRKKYIPSLKEYIRQGKLPSIVYKYIPFDYLDTLIKNSELKFSSPTSFNDPYDCQIEDQTAWDEDSIRKYLQSAKERVGGNTNIEEVIDTYKKEPNSFTQYFTDILKCVLSQGGVACFAKEPDNPLLWAHYTNKHTGVCLAFDIREHYEFFGITLPVKYVIDYPKFDFNKDNEIVPRTILFTKSKVWEYESEIRTIMPNYANYHFNKACLKEIIFGCKVTTDKINLIGQLVNEMQYPEVKLKQIKTRKYEYAIDIINL